MGHAGSGRLRFADRERHPCLPGGDGESVAEFLLHDAEPLKIRQGGQRGFLIEFLQREPDVHDDVVADGGVRDILQANLFHHTTKVDIGHHGVI